MSDWWFAKCVPKLFYKLVLIAFVAYVISLMCIYHSRLQEIRASRKHLPYVVHKQMKYILQWTRRFSAPFDFMGAGNSAFVKNKCKYTNCFVTDDADYFLNLTDFNAIAFNGRDVVGLWPFQLPQIRSPKQKYIFGALEPADNFPACSEWLDNFFNWTWTYKLDSDVYWGYMRIFDKAGNTVGPAIDMQWPEHMDPISEDLKAILDQKSKFGAWFVSNCKTKNRREDFIAEVSAELEKYGHKIDIYGACGEFSCPKFTEVCYNKVTDYYFYFSFENSFAEDYVTEKVVTALNYYAIPVVYGSAVYSRYLPEGSYLNARELGPKKLVQTMIELISNKTRYYDFFRWRNHFSYMETSGSAGICNLCEALNDEEMVKTDSVWVDFRKWWNGERHVDNCL